jgi:hypothetical protein
LATGLRIKLLTAADIADGIVTNAKLAGSISNDKLLPIQNAALQNSSVTYNSVTVALGSSGTITTTETGPTFTSISPSVIDNTASKYYNHRNKFCIYSS